LGIPFGEDNLAAAKLVEFAETILQNANFQWTASPVPDVADLTAEEPIETVVMAADKSVEDYRSELNNAVDAIQVNWEERFEEDIELATDEVHKAVATQKEHLDEDKKAYKSNYRKCRESSNAILAKCESVRTEAIVSE
jgi:rubrerythrin